MSQRPAIATSNLNWVRTGPRGCSPVVLIHPVGLDLTYWDAQVDALRSAHDVVAFDLPGHGRSPGRPQDCTFDHFAAVVADLIAWIDAGPAHVVGISVGGMIAQALALSHPGSVRSLALIATAATFSDAGRVAVRSRADTIRTGGMAALVPPSLERWFTPQTLAGRPHLIDRVTKTLLGDDPAVQAAMWTMVADLEVLNRVGQIRCPTLVVVGDRDPSTPPAASAAIAERIPGATLVVLPDASHMVQLEAPTALNVELLKFLWASGGRS